VSTEALVLLLITGGIHAMGIGAFLLWMAAGHPTSLVEFKLWFKKQRFLPDWFNKETL
jgi:hypothetical protein